MPKQESPASSVTDFPSFFSTSDDPDVAGTSPETSSNRLFAVVLLDQLRLVERVEENCFEFGDLVLRDAELVDQGVIEELHVRQVLAAVVAIDRRNIRGLQDRLTQPNEFFLLILRPEDLFRQLRYGNAAGPNFRAELSSSA
jgi:hypothetical protein